MSVYNGPFMEKQPSVSELQREKERLQSELRKKPIVFAILAGAGLLLAVSFLRISLETYASPGDEKMVTAVGTAMLFLALFFLAAAIAFLVVFLVKMSKRKKKNRRIQEIDSEIRNIQGSDTFARFGGSRS